jgi:hypothetical protein
MIPKKTKTEQKKKKKAASSAAARPQTPAEGRARERDQRPESAESEVRTR